MKAIHHLVPIGILLLSISFIFSGCKKTIPSPLFNITYTTINLQGGSAGVQFYASCTTTDVQMTKVDVVIAGVKMPNYTLEEVVRAIFLLCRMWGLDMLK